MSVWGRWGSLRTAGRSVSLFCADPLSVLRVLCRGSAALRPSVAFAAALIAVLGRATYVVWTAGVAAPQWAPDMRADLSLGPSAEDPFGPFLRYECRKTWPFKPCLGHTIRSVAQTMSKRQLFDHCRPAVRHFDVRLFLSALLSFFQTHGIQYWVESGTLLGWHRTGEVIPWDPDADISMLYSEYGRVGDWILSFAPSGYAANAPMYWHDAEGVWSASAEGAALGAILRIPPPATRQTGFVYPTDILMVWFDPVTGVYADTFVYDYAEDTKGTLRNMMPFYSEIMPCAGCARVGLWGRFVYRMPAEYVFPLTTGVMRDVGVEVSVPAQPSAVLRYMYGGSLRPDMEWDETCQAYRETKWRLIDD